MSNIKKITSVFATLFCMGQSAVANASFDSKEALSSTLDSGDSVFSKKDNAFTNADIGSEETHKKIFKSLPLTKNSGRLFLFNFHGTKTRPSENLQEGEKIYRRNVPDFRGLKNCGISNEQASMFYSRAQDFIRSKNETWKKEYDPDLSKYQISRDKMNKKLSGLINIVKHHAIDYYKCKSNVPKAEQIEKLRKYSYTLANGIDRLAEGLESTDLSDMDKNEINETIKKYNEDPKVKLVWYNKMDVIPLRNVIIKLGEAKIIHLYTKLLLKVIDEIENPENLLIDDLYQNPSDGKNENNMDIIKDKIINLILNDKSTVSKKLKEELSKIVLSPDSFFDKFNDYESYKPDTNLPRYNRIFNDYGIN